jgi:hypothetical protein
MPSSPRDGLPLRRRSRKRWLRTSAAKAETFALLAARLKPCPSLSWFPRDRRRVGVEFRNWNWGFEFGRLQQRVVAALYSSVGRTQLTTTATKKISIVAKSRLNPNLSSSISGLARIARGTWSVDNASIVIQKQVSLQYLRYFRVGREITAPTTPAGKPHPLNA